MSRPITDAVLWVNHPKLVFERVAGLAVVERQLFTLSQAGIRRVWVAARRDERTAKLRVPEGLEVHWVEREGDGPVECSPPYAGVSADHFIRREALRELLAAGYRGHVSFQDDRRQGVVQIIPYRGERVILFDKRPMPEGSWVRLQNPMDHARVLPWLLETARKGHDGLMARLFDRRLSLAVTRILLRTPIKPNHMTVLSSAVGVAGALLFAHPRLAIPAALIVWLHSVLDGCDGELARLRFQESRLGGVLDFWGDNVVHVALFLSLGVGAWRQEGDWGMLVLGAVAAAASLAAAALTFVHSLRRAREAAPLFDGLAIEAPPTATARVLRKVEDFLAQRDFIYLLVVAAVLGKEQLFLLAGAIGAPAFLGILLYLTFLSGSPSAAPAKAGPPALQTTSRGTT